MSIDPTPQQRFDPAMSDPASPVWDNLTLEAFGIHPELENQLVEAETAYALTIDIISPTDILPGVGAAQIAAWRRKYEIECGVYEDEVAADLMSDEFDLPHGQCVAYLALDGLRTWARQERV